MNNFHDKKILITGGLGFIGSNLARALVHQGARVTLVDSLMPQYGGNLFDIVDIVFMEEKQDVRQLGRDG